MKEKDHQDNITKEREVIAHLSENIKTMLRDNGETMEQICQDADDEIREIEKKN